MDLKNHGSCLSDFLEAISDASPGRKVVLATRLNPSAEIREKISEKFRTSEGRPGTLKKLLHDLDSSGWRAVSKTAAFPNFNSARFFIPFDDKDSHAFLFNDILVPRRYSLPLLLRILIRVYNAILMTPADASFLFRHVYILVEKI
ncbi:MAG: hypothetical protein GY859_15615 [Desulfobacterales bacterium]|nr:hypothetical protein [Desulfobacterales bacterium]